MSVTLAIGDAITVRIICTAEGQVAYNVRHGIITALGGAGLPDSTLAADLATTLGPEYKDLIGTLARFEGVSVQIRRLDALFAAQFSNNESGEGTLAGDMLPTQVCGLIRFRSNFAGRQGRGRLYVPFPTESVNDADGDPTAPYLAAMVDLADNLIGSFVSAEGENSATLNWRVSSSTLGSQRPITAYDLRTKWATQRRRSEIRGGDRPFA